MAANPAVVDDYQAAAHEWIALAFPGDARASVERATFQGLLVAGIPAFAAPLKHLGEYAMTASEACALAAIVTCGTFDRSSTERRALHALGLALLAPTPAGELPTSFLMVDLARRGLDALCPLGRVRRSIQLTHAFNSTNAAPKVGYVLNFGLAFVVFQTPPSPTSEEVLLAFTPSRDDDVCEVTEFMMQGPGTPHTRYFVLQRSAKLVITDLQVVGDQMLATCESVP